MPITLSIIIPAHNEKVFIHQKWLRLLNALLKPFATLYYRALSRPVDFLRKDPLFRHAILLMASSMVVILCHLAYQMVVGRILPRTEFTLLAAFLAVFAIAGRPFGTLSAAMNHYTSILLQEGKQSLLGRLMIKWGLLTAVPSVALAVICIVFASRIADFFNIERIEPVIVAALAIPAISIAPVFMGTLGGMQRFGIASLASSLGAVGRLALGAVIVYGLYPACGWALIGPVGGMYITFLITLVALTPSFTAKAVRNDGDKLPSLRWYIFWSFLIELSVAVLMTGDVILIRHYIPLEVDFAYAATLSRTIVFFSAAVGLAMFPKVATGGEFTPAHRSLYLRSLFYTGVLAVVSLLICIGIPGFALRVLFDIDAPDASLIRMTRWMGLVMGVATLLQLNVSLLLAQRRFSLLFVTILCAIAYIGGVHLWGATIDRIIAIAGITNLVAFIVTTAGILWPVRKPSPQRFTPASSECPNAPVSQNIERPHPPLRRLLRGRRNPDHRLFPGLAN